MASEITTKDVITIGMAAVGSALGIFNTWVAYRRGQPRIRVTPQTYSTELGGTLVSSIPTPMSAEWEEVCVEITNTGGISLTISEIGFLIRGDSSGRHVIRNFANADNPPLGRKLGPRESMVAYLAPGGGVASIRNGAWKAYATTSCGVTANGVSRAFTALRDRIQSASPSPPHRERKTD